MYVCIYIYAHICIYTKTHMNTHMITLHWTTNKGAPS